MFLYASVQEALALLEPDDEALDAWAGCVYAAAVERGRDPAEGPAP